MKNRRKYTRPTTIIRPQMGGPLCIIRKDGKLYEGPVREETLEGPLPLRVQYGLTDEQKAAFMPPPKIHDIRRWNQAQRLAR